MGTCNGSEDCASDGQNQMTAGPELACFLTLTLS